MKLIHVFWQQQQAFSNWGQLYLWVESSPTSTRKSNSYPYQLKKEQFLDWAETHFNKHIAEHESLSVHLPCNTKKDFIPSPLIANLNAVEDTECTELKQTHINVVKVKNPLSFIKELKFQSYYFDEDIQLADDAQFWIKMGSALSRVIKNDQYIPCMVARKQDRKIHYYSKWQPLSSSYQQQLKYLAEQMPYSASLGSAVSYSRITALEHFSEVSLTELIASTQFPKKTIKQVEGSILEQNIDVRDLSFVLPDSVWKDWKLWKNNLAYDQFGSPFQICFRLNEASSQPGNDWGLELLLQSKEDPSFMVDLQQYWQERESNQSLYQKMFGTSVERTLLLQIGYASRIYPRLEQYFEQQLQTSELTLDTETAFQFLKEDAWALHAYGYRIIVPSWWTHKGSLKAKVKLRASKSSRSESDKPTSYFDRDNIVAFDYQLSIGDHAVSKEEWEALVHSKSQLVYFRGEWIEIDPEEMKKVQELIEKSKDEKQFGTIKDLLTIAADNEVYDLEFDSEIQQMMEGLTNKDKLALIQQPKGLEATLRPYQRRGLSWLHYLETLGMSPCLADDMGLGKTMQVIALLLSSPKNEPALLVAPTSVIGNWDREIKKFAPSIKASVHHGSDRKKQKAFREHVDKLDVIITSYGLLRRDKQLFQSRPWSRLIIDEAQNIKNPSAAQTKELCKVKAGSRIALSGTPIENRLTDLWSIFHFLNPGFLGGKANFKRVFELPIQRDGDEYQTKTLKRLVEPFILRRLKTDKTIIKDLPEKVEQKVYCQLTTEQATIYQSIVDQAEERMEETEPHDNAARSAIILSTLLRLKQVCNHPSQALQDGSEFSIDRSVKLQRMVDMIAEIIQNKESVLIFSQFTEVCDQLERLLKTQFGYTTHYLHGGTTRKKRESMIKAFQAADAPPSVFVLSLKAGGVGITLTKANHVIHFDRWWNPAVENQATDRAYRIGQQKTVFAHKFITMGTIEERIDQMLEDKQKVSDSIVGNDESWLSKLNAKSFMKLIRLSQSSLEEVYDEHE